MFLMELQKSIILLLKIAIVLLKLIKRTFWILLLELVMQSLNAVSGITGINIFDSIAKFDQYSFV